MLVGNQTVTGISKNVYLSPSDLRKSNTILLKSSLWYFYKKLSCLEPFDARAKLPNKLYRYFKMFVIIEEGFNDLNETWYAQYMGDALQDKPSS